MYSHVVLLRGVNVGGAKRVPMASFKTLLLELGCQEVKTLLNSGNAVVSRSSCSSDTLASQIVSAIHEAFGFDVPVVVKSVREFHGIVSGNKLLSGTTNHSRLLIAFAQNSRDLAAWVSLSDIVRAPDRFLLGAKAAYLDCPNGILESAAAKALLGKVGQGITTRNWATVLKIQDALK